MVKRVSKELKMTYRELGQAIGYSESTLRKSVSRDEISPQLKRALELYVENVDLKDCVDKIKSVKREIEELFKRSLEELETLEAFVSKKGIKKDN